MRNLILIIFIFTIVLLAYYTYLKANSKSVQFSGKMKDFNKIRPTKDWKAVLDGGDDHFNKAGINVSDNLLDLYLRGLDHASNDNDIWKEIESVVTGFDAVNLKYGYFIETMEREALAEYIQSAAEHAGLVYDGDVTEEWRMEW